MRLSSWLALCSTMQMSSPGGRVCVEHGDAENKPTRAGCARCRWVKAQCEVARNRAKVIQGYPKAVQVITGVNTVGEITSCTLLRLSKVKPRLFRSLLELAR